MSLKNFFNDLNIDWQEDKMYLIALGFLSIILFLLMFKFNEIRGPFSPDIYVYLGGALNYAGLNIFPNVDPIHVYNPNWMINSPFTCFLISILFRLGWVDITAMFAVTGFLGVMGIFGMYSLLKVRFSPLLSFTGAILYNSFSLTLYYFASGMLDTAAVSMIIWTFIFTFAAVDRNPKYYILASVFFVLTFFTRFTTAFILALMLLYFLKNHDLINLVESLFSDVKTFKNRILNFIKSKEFKWLFVSLIIGISLTMLIILDLINHGSFIGYFELANGSMQHSTDVYNPNYVTDKFFYVKNFLNLLFSNNIVFEGLVEKFINASFISYLIMAILSIGVLLKLVEIKKNFNFYLNHTKNVSSNKNFTKILLLVSCLLLVVFVVGFKFNYMISIFAFWVFLIILMSYFKGYPINQDNFALFLVSIGMIVFYFVIFSYNYMKCVRYILPIFPFFVYLVIYALEILLNFIDDMSSKFNVKEYINVGFKLKVSNLIPIFLIIIFLFAAFNFTNTVDLDYEAKDIESVINFLSDYDSNIQSKEIVASTSYKIFEWYFNNVVDFLPVSEFSENSTNYDYVIQFGELNNKNYHKIYNSGNYNVYELN